MQAEINSKSHLVFRADRSPYIAFTVMFGGIGLLSLYVAIFLHPSFWQAVVICFGVYVSFILWFRAFQVTITDDGVRLASLFADKSLHWSEIASAEIRVGYAVRYGAGDALRPPFRLVIMPKEGIDKVPIVINIKLLSLRDLQRLCVALESRLEVTKFDRPAFMRPQ